MTISITDEEQAKAEGRCLTCGHLRALHEPCVSENEEWSGHCNIADCPCAGYDEAGS